MPQATTPAASVADPDQKGQAAALRRVLAAGHSRVTILDSLRQGLATADALAADTSGDFIVVCQGVPLLAIAEGDMVVRVRAAGLAAASRFSEADAAALAAQVRNGNGVAGKAVALAAFAKADADSLRKTLALVDQGVGGRG